MEHTLDEKTMKRSSASSLDSNSLQSTIEGSQHDLCSSEKSPFADDIPDGGFRAWSVVLGSYFALFATFGVVNAFGVFREYYTAKLLPNSSPPVISLIGSFQICINYGLSPVIGKIFDAYGTQILLPLSTVITTVALLLLSLVQEDKPYQVFLSHGILFGIGNAFALTPSMAIIGHWFKRRRAFAIGIAISGSSMGGLCFPILLKHLIPTVGFAWSIRILAFIVFCCLVVSCLTMRTRLRLSGSVALGDAVDFEGFRDGRYLFAGIAAFFIFFALFIPYFYIESFANFQGVPPEISKYQLVIMNASGVVARILQGILADHVGPLNIVFPSTMVSGVLVLALWLPARGAVPITVFSALYGLFSGAFMSLLPAYIATITPIEKLGARLGALYTIVAVSTLAGTPTAGAFIRTVDQVHFDRLIVFSGVVVLVGGCAVGVIHYWSSRRGRSGSE